MITAEAKTDLWPHQAKGIQETLEAIGQGHRRICLTSPTGGGKSRMACELIQAWLEQGLKVGLYTNRKLLIEQTVKVMNRAGISHGVRASGWETDLGRDVQISSIQTEHARVLRAKTWSLHDADRVLIDEAHIQKGDVAKRILDMHHQEGGAYVGLTATPLDIGDIYDHLIVAGTNSELRQCGALLPCLHYGPDEPDTKHIKRQKSGEFSENDVRKIIMTSTIFARVFDWYKILNPDSRPSILFAPGVGESIWFAEQFQAKGIRAAHIDGEECWLDGNHYKSDRKAREDIIAMSEAGEIKIICNRFVLREGIDLPWLFHAIFATVYGSLQSYLQSGGRLLRYHPFLTNVVLQDHGGNWWRHGSLNADRHWELEFTANMVAGLRDEGLRRKRCRKCSAPITKPMCGRCGFLNEVEPVRCPQCSAILTRSRCICGYEVDLRKKTRPVVQKDGSLKEHTGDIFKPRITRMKPDTEAVWRKMYHRAKRSGMTFRQAEALFFVENHYYPPRDLPLMPRADLDLVRKVNKVPTERLT